MTRRSGRVDPTEGLARLPGHDGHRERCRAGDCLFVAAGIEHRFERFSDDFGVWVLFYGPDGGESPGERES